MRRFTPEDFAQMPYGPGYGVQMEAARIANNLLDQQLREAEMVQGRKVGLQLRDTAARFMWTNEDKELIDCTHKAKLLCITEIDKPWPWEKP